VRRGCHSCGVPFIAPDSEGVSSRRRTKFSFKEDPDVFCPRDLVGLARTGAGIANAAGDLVLVPVSKYSFQDDTLCQPVNRVISYLFCRNYKSIVLAPLDSPDQCEPLEIFLPQGGESFWLDNRTVAYVVDEHKKHLSIYAIRINFTAPIGDSGLILSAPDMHTLIATLPTSSATKFRYLPASEYLVFSDSVYADGNIWTVNASPNFQ